MTFPHPIKITAKALLLAAALTSIPVQAAQTAATACLTPADAQSVAVAALPDALASTRLPGWWARWSGFVWRYLLRYFCFAGY